MITKAIAIVVGIVAGLAINYSVTPEEDQPGWDCRTMGNHVCGPNNDMGYTPGYYDSRGELVK